MIEVQDTTQMTSMPTSLWNLFPVPTLKHFYYSALSLKKHQENEAFSCTLLKKKLHVVTDYKNCK